MLAGITKTERIIELFGRQIVSGEYAPGSALPSENELCAEFDTSRNIIREAVKVLSAKRLIDAQRHRGLFVMPREGWNYLDSDVLRWALEKDGGDRALIAALNDVRSVVEPAIGRWAAECATAMDLAHIEMALNDMEKHASGGDKDAFNEADIRFHKAVLAAARNPVMLQLADAISALQRAIFDRTFLNSEALIQLTLEQHKDLFEAIRYKDGAAAEAASLTMIRRTARRMLERDQAKA
ncbi:FadR/GntR family transcriptional regulator [Uliginosibacterium sp. sgz301328]|uniref:FadR/GntR family transcriptional regulator n=1 Tax=Uliginosibacterium sp. sgz301328 TaxID=3243764 RepID=UPI00359DDF8D